MLVARYTPAVAPLAGGKILVTGGVTASAETLSTAEIFDPSTGTSTPTGSMATEHLWGGWGAALPTLPDGRILVAGGVNGAGTIQGGAELYDPDAGTFSPTGPMAQAVVSMFPVILADGTVLEIGGSAVSMETSPSSCPGVFGCWSGAGISEVQRYSPITGSFAATGALAENRPWGCNVVLANGKVLALGVPANVKTPDQNIEQYDPVAGTWQTAGTMPTAYCGQAFTLPNGQVLMVGTGATPDAQLLDPITFTTTPTMGDVPPGWHYSDVQLANGDVVSIGTYTTCPTPYFWRYYAAGNSWSRVLGGYVAPEGLALVLLSNGDVAIVGHQADVWIFHP